MGYRLRESLKYPLVRAMWPLGVDWRARYVPSTLTGLVLGLKRLGWEPNTCVDVGVAWGTRELQQGFPHSAHILIEPNPMFAPYLTERCSRKGWTLYQAAASDERGSVDFLIHKASDQGGRIANEGEDLSAFGRMVSVPCVPLDDLDRDASFGDGIFLKVDAEGHEHEVLRGAKNVLQRCELVVVETRCTGRATTSDIVAELLRSELHLAGFLTAWSESSSRRLLKMVDVVFIRRGGPLW
jgi:FkbM family methyltransferase